MATFTGTSANETLTGGTAADTILGDYGNDTLNGDAGDDLMYGGSGQDSLSGDAGSDLLEGGDGQDTLDGGANDDRLAGGAGNDQLTGGAGIDALIGDDDNDILSGDDGADALFGGLGDDTLYGGAGAENFAVEAGNDVLYGGNDQDSFAGGIGDTVDGGEGGVDSDLLDVSTWGWSLTNIIYDPLNHENGVVQFLDTHGAVIGTMSFTNIETVLPCFTPGTRIRTARGQVRVEKLRVGDLVATRDEGLQPVRWIGRRDLSLADLIVQPQLQPVRIAAGALAAGCPARDMMVSPQHRMLVQDARAEMLFGEGEVLVAALHLLALPGVKQVLPAGVSYIHLLFDAHQIIEAEGAWTESFQPADRTRRNMGDQQRAEIEALFPELVVTDQFPAARLTLKRHEARVLLTV